MKIYNIDDHGCFLSEEEISMGSLLPRNAVTIPPPPPLDGHYPVFANDSWHYVPELKHEEYNEMLKLLEEKYKNSKVAPVLYKPYDYDEEALFEASKETIDTTLQYCTRKGIPLNQQIPMNDGKWDTIEPGYGLPFKVKDLDGLWNAIYERGMYNYVVYTAHKRMLKQIHDDPTKGKKDIKGYDLNSGWHVKKA